MADEAAPASVGTIIQVGYTVQNPHMTPAAARAIVQGKEMVATVDSFEVQLVADLASNGGIMLRFLGDDIPAAQALFVNDAKVTANFVAAPSQSPPVELPPPEQELPPPA